MRGKRSTLAAVAAVGVFLAQAAGCGGCVKDDPQPGSGPSEQMPSKPVNLKAIDQRLSQFSLVDDAAADASAGGTD